MGSRHLALLIAAAAALAASALTGPSAAASGRAKGIDVSNWNGSIKWTKVASAGYRFAFGKATEGTTFVDGTYTTNRTASEAAGLSFGAYHFARPAGTNLSAVTASAVAQADYFLDTASPQPGELPPVLDLEKTGGLKSTRLVNWTVAWVTEVESRLGVDPFVYSSPAFWKSYLGDSTAVAAAGAKLWIAHWTSASSPWVPAQNWNGEGWTFWQWTDCAVVPGIAHCADGDRMNGLRPAKVAIPAYPAGVPVLDTPPSIVGPPEAGKLLAGLPGSWAGGKPLDFTYQWKRCDAAAANCVSIDGATHESYRPTTDDVGHSLKLLVTATSAEGSANAFAPPTVSVSPPGTPPSQRPKDIDPPLITGQPEVGQVLTSSVGTWSGSPKKFAYQWQRCDATGANCIAIPKAIDPSYTVTPDDIGSTITLRVTATGAGGSSSAQAAATGVAIAAPLPPVSTGSQRVEQGVAGNVETEDGCATLTWQPGAVPVGLTVSLATFTGTLTLPGCDVALTVPGLPAYGFAWPLDIALAQPLPADVVLGYSLDGAVYQAVPPLNPPVLQPGSIAGSYVDSHGLTHVLTYTPLQLGLFERGSWGDPTYTALDGLGLVRQKPLRVLFRRANKSVSVLTRLGTAEQSRLTATITGTGGRRVSILRHGSRLGAKLPPGRPLHVVKAELDRPGAIRLRLRLNGRLLRTGAYTLTVAAVDPWGRTETFTQKFEYRRPAKTHP